MSEKAGVKRPISPHLQVYGWGAHMLTSILHRATGMALTVGLLVLTLFLVALASGPAQFDAFLACAASPLGRLVLFGITFALMQHMASGIRHLFMDTGALFDLGINTRSAYFTYIFSIIGTLAIWVAAYKVLGAL